MSYSFLLSEPLQNQFYDRKFIPFTSQCDKAMVSILKADSTITVLSQSAKGEQATSVLQEQNG